MGSRVGTTVLGGIELLASDLLIETGPVDHSDWNYKPVLGWLQRQRFRLLLNLIGAEHFDQLLEIGYGSGLFAPELSHHCDDYSGIDIHERNSDVEGVLESVGVPSTLRIGSASSMPYEDDTFDCIVGVSVLEFVDDINLSCKEMVRVLRPHGKAFVTVTGDSAILDLGLRLVTGESADHDFSDRRAGIEPAIREHLVIDDVSTFPRISALGIDMYRAFGLSVRP